jgi:hypothetical protein
MEDYPLDAVTTTTQGRIMEWVSAQDRLPKKEAYYRCMCVGFSKSIKCKLRKARNGPLEYSPSFFLYKKRVPYVIYWKSVDNKV